LRVALLPSLSSGDVEGYHRGECEAPTVTRIHHRGAITILAPEVLPWPTSEPRKPSRRSVSPDLQPRRTRRPTRPATSLTKSCGESSGGAKPSREIRLDRSATDVHHALAPANSIDATAVAAIAPPGPTWCVWWPLRLHHRGPFSRGANHRQDAGLDRLEQF